MELPPTLASFRETLRLHVFPTLDRTNLCVLTSKDCSPRELPLDMAHEEQDIAHGTQRGDPAKAANAIIAAVDADSHVRACCSATLHSTLLAGSPTAPGPPEG